MGEGTPRWRGQSGRMEVWYATLDGLWLHYEVVAPSSGAAAHGHGWIAVFPPEEKPHVERFGPAPVQCSEDVWFDSAGCTASGTRLAGRTETMAWDLSYTDDSPTLFTFPRWAWRREVLPAAQVVPSPSAQFTGWVERDGVRTEVDGQSGRGNLAHIYGHGNAQRWGWLHADLGGGDVLEVVTAVSRRPGLNKLKPLALMQLRVDGKDWPRDPVLSALTTRTRLRPDGFHVRGRGIEIDVDIPEDRSVTLDYADPDGAPAQCTNSERAIAHVRFHDREWRLHGTAHAEVGFR